ncbi:MAG: DUF1549 domain-containing protein [Limisphaerales bacterium]
MDPLKRIFGLLVASVIAINAPAVDFSHEIVPILKTHCSKCHLGDKRKGGFSMNTREDLLQGGENGRAITLGKANQSLLVELLATKDEDDRMPPDGEPLAPKQIELIKKWINDGATWESGFRFDQPAYEPPLHPRRPKLPPAIAGRSNPIDRIIDHYLKGQGLARPKPINDATFARRVHLDLVGLLPDPDKLAPFIAANDVTKRHDMIDEILANDVAYAEHWLTFWNDLLRNDYSGTGFITGGRKQITDWLYRSLIDNKPYDQFVTGLIAPTPESEGFIKGIKWRGDVNSSQTLQVQFAQNVAQVFLGINLKCASCHDSFIDRWKLNEAYSMAAIYGTEKIEIHRCDKPTGRFAAPKWLFPELGDVDPKAAQPERLKQLAQLMVHPQNGRTTRTIVNRIWHRLMGRGIIHPVDAMQIEPWNADLLDFLAADLADHKFDLKHTLKLIVSSQAYQSQALSQKEEPKPGAYTYRGPLSKRMTAEQFLDSIWQITDAGPSVPAVNVFRGKIEPGKTIKSEVNGKWVWSYPEGSSSKPKAGERITLRKSINLKQRPQLATAVITADNEYALYVNNTLVKSDNHWPSVEVLNIGTLLKPGNNYIMIVGKNAGSSPNSAAVFFEARLVSPDGKETVVATDKTWQWTKSIPITRRNRASFKKPPTDWKPAAEVTNQSYLPGTLRRTIMTRLAQIHSAENYFVRASLVKLDFLSRSLGRPFRDQVVTTRPDGLTTLQAIDLQNGQILNEIIQRAAKNVAARGMSNTALVNWTYLSALSRTPTMSERQVAQGILKAGKDTQGIEDLLWVTFMLPEFQLIR